MSTRDSPNETQNTISIKSSNIQISDLDEVTNEKLKGDAIGNTLYSQSFVLKTLMKFSKCEWGEEFEEDLCFLWDMTMEKDVCTYLSDLSYPAIACAALENTDEPRFIEIVIGILANILCVDCQSRKYFNGEVDIVLKELDSDDPLILIQVMRFISAVTNASSEMTCIDEEKMLKIKFIMNNSINQDLLKNTLETVAKLMLHYKLNSNLVNLELYEVTLTAYNTIFSNQENFCLDCKDKVDICKYTLEIISNICNYVDNFEKYELLLELQRDSNKYVNEVLKILHYFSLEENLLPVTEEIIFFMSVFRYTLTTLNINFIPNLFKVLCKILLLIKDIQHEVGDMFDSTVELMCFLISSDTNHEFINIIKSLSKNKEKTVLQTLKDNQHKYDYKLNLQDFMTE